MRVTLNIGLVPGDKQKRLAPSMVALMDEDDRLTAACRWAIDKLGGPIFIHYRRGSESHEPFVIVEGTVVGDAEQMRREVYRLAATLDQDCIAMQYTAPWPFSPGQLVGPYTKDWEPFQPKLFHMIPR